MPFKEVNNLRKSGNLLEALNLGVKEFQNALDNESETIWEKRALSWVYYEYLKTNSSFINYNIFSENLNKIKDLQLGESENMLFDACAWQIGKLVFDLSKQFIIDYGKAVAIFEMVKSFHFSKPSEAYSFLFKAFHKIFKESNFYLDIVNWWDLNHFNKSDFEKDEVKGKKIMSIAEQTYIAYSKKLLQRNNITEIDQFIPKLDKIIVSRPEYKYTLYFKAKLLIAKGDNESILPAFLPFVKRNLDKFWVWELLGDQFENDNKLVCYAKALACKATDELLVKLRYKFAKLLVIQKKFNEAKTEIENVIKTRNKNGWKITNDILDFQKKEWFVNASSLKNNNQFYSKHSSKANELIFSKDPEELIVVTNINTEKELVSFMKNKNETGFFRLNLRKYKLKIGDILKVRFTELKKSQFRSILTLKNTKSDHIDNMRIG